MTDVSVLPHLIDSAVWFGTGLGVGYIWREVRDAARFSRRA